MDWEVLFLIFKIFGIFILFYVIYFLLRPLVTGAVYFPTKQRDIKTILELAEIKPGEKVVDLGSGDGRILIELAKSGCHTDGYEINPLLVRVSRAKIKELGLQNLAVVYKKSLWRANLSQYDVIVVYGFPHIMKRLEKKIKKEARLGAKVVSNVYQFPGLKPTMNKNGVNLYKI